MNILEEMAERGLIDKKDLPEKPKDGKGVLEIIYERIMADSEFQQELDRAQKKQFLEYSACALRPVC